MYSTQDHRAIVELEKRAGDQLTAAHGKRPSNELKDMLSLWADAVFTLAERSEPAMPGEQTVAHGLSLVNNPVFVCGVHRSGTTLVRDLLDGHPQLIVLPSEGTFITSTEPALKRVSPQCHKRSVCTEWLKRLANPINKSPYWLLGHSSQSSSPYVQFAQNFSAWWNLLEQHHVNSLDPLSCVMLAYASTTGTLSNMKYWVEKTPTNEQHLTRLRREFPKAKFIHVLRNPIDVLASRKKIEPWTKFRKFIPDLLASYKIALHQSRLNNADYLLLRYEDICDHPEISIGAIEAFLDIRGADTLSQPTVAGLSTSPNSSFNSTLPSGRIHKLANAEKQVLTDGEQDLAQTRLGAAARALGYNIAEIPLHRKLCVYAKGIFDS